MKNRFGLVLILFTTIIPAVSAATYSDIFIGLSTDLMVKVDPEGISGSSILRISQVFTYGPPSIHPFRVRAGLGWFKDQPFAVTVGVELPVLERLSSRKTRSIGLYLVADGGVTIHRNVGVEVRAWLVGVLPFSQLGGLAIGVGLDNANGLVFSIGYWAGVFPLLQ